MPFLVQGVVREALSPAERIVARNRDIASFWSKAKGWAPDEAADLLSRSRLDRQVSLSESLLRWTTGEPLSDGDLILAWTNLGALLEGTLKLFLGVYYRDYISDVEKTRFHKVFDRESETHRPPDGLMLESLSQYFRRTDLLDDAGLTLVGTIQTKRNAIHAFKERDIGTTEEFLAAVSAYQLLLEDLNGRLPYPV